MKRLQLLPLLLSLGFLVGCSTNMTQSDCEQAAKTYTAYLKTIETGGLLTPEQIAQAKLAGEFLTISCGWLPVAKHKALAVHDGNGVLYLVKP